MVHVRTLPAQLILNAELQDLLGTHFAKEQTFIKITKLILATTLEQQIQPVPTQLQRFFG